MKTRKQSSQLLTAAIALVGASAAGCVVGDGTGSASGMLFMLGCDDGSDVGTPTAPAPYDLQPRYFVGEPIEDIADPSPAHPAANTLIIRMQHNGNALEITDTLYFTIPDSGKIAACLRGQTVNGVPQWDTSTGLADPMPTTPAWCMQPVAVADGGSGFPRIRLFASGPVRVSFTPFGTCVSTMHPPAIVSITGVAIEGYIDFINFGVALDQNNVPSDMRTGVGNDFKIDFGQRLRANFNFTMGDDRVETARKLGVDPLPDPVIGGNMAGNFDFNLERGQGAQTFP